MARRPARAVTPPPPDPANIEGQEQFPTSPAFSFSAQAVTDVLYRFVAGDESLHAEAMRAAAASAPLLIMGEPGTGKSALARFIHDQSRRRSGRFVEFHCDGISESLLPAQLFGDRQTRPGEAPTGDVGVIRDAQGGTLLISGFEKGAGVLCRSLLPWLDERGERRAGSNPLYGDARLVLAADQDIRNHVDRAFWQRLVAWPPILLTPLRVQRRKKWNLFCTFVDRAAAEQGGESPVTVDFLLYAFVVGYGWPGNARQLADFACYLVAVGALQNRELSADQEFCFFDTSEAFAQDDVLEASGIAQGPARVFRNRVHRDFVRAVRELQSSESGRVWQELSKASPSRAGTWSYAKIRWSDPHFAGAEMCARVGQAYDGALAALGQWHERPSARELVYLPSELPWVSEPASPRVVPGLSRTELADLVAYGLVTGEIAGKEAFLTQVYEALVRIAPELTPADFQELGIPKARIKGLLSRR